MAQPGSFASLSPRLLARKGGARPAMRSALSKLGQAGDEADDVQDDLGWNDMGDDRGAPADGADVVSIHPGRAQRADAPSGNALPQVLRTRAAVVATFAGAPTRRSALAEGRRCAFTLRLDAERHLRLRLASTIDARSAQAILTQALDRYLAEVPELDELAARTRASSRKS